MVYMYVERYFACYGYVLFNITFSSFLSNFHETFTQMHVYLRYGHRAEGQGKRAQG